MENEPQEQAITGQSVDILADLKDLERRQQIIAPEERRAMDMVEQASTKYRKGIISQEEFKDALQLLRKERTVNGIDFSSVQFSQVVQHGDMPLEIEAFSPYLCDYNMQTGDIWSDRLVPSDAIGLRIGKILHRTFPEARIISLYDEYNSSLPDSSDARGIPAADAPQYKYPDDVKEAFKQSVTHQLRDAGVIESDAQENQDYLLISESSKVEQAEQLVRQLEDRGAIERNGEEIAFVNDLAENPLYRRILLRTKTGHWLCEALDAASYINPENTETMHLVVLPDSMREQQDKVWEILRLLGIPKLNYHNIFFDEGTDPEVVVGTIRQELARFI